ncbi:MAG: hypothetical protein K1X78_27360 [Verrucomicrobiaceae bacterium]|nr:hypothetical protein [Verrucomicrobiaceae bacterium]
MESSDQPQPVPAPQPAPPRRTAGCLATLGLTFIAALIIAGIVVWKLVDASSGLAQQGLSFFSGLPERFQQQHITETFRESVTRIDPTHGDILEVATLEADETVSKFDMKTLFNDVLYLGSTFSEIKVPAVYRFHIKITDDWKLSTDGNVVTVVAPVIRPTLPPAIRTERMEKRSESGWLRFNKKESLAELEKNLTPTLERRAGSPGKIKQVREPGRKAVAEFVQRWLLKEDQWKPGSFGAIVVVFADEPEAKDLVKAKALPATLRL